MTALLVLPWFSNHRWSSCIPLERSFESTVPYFHHRNWRNQDGFVGGSILSENRTKKGSRM